MNKQSLYRLWHTIRLYMIMDSSGRATYLQKHHVFHQIGEGCTIMERKVPLCPKLISIGNNVHLASRVLLVTHDAIHLCLNAAKRQTGDDGLFKEKIGCIEIGNDVFVGSNSTILCDVRIGSKVIIGAGSLINKDIPSNSVAVGIPARVVGTFDDFVLKRREMQMYPDKLTPVGHIITEELENWCWNDFNERRKRKGRKI